MVASCDLGHSCTEMGCGDGVGVKLTTPDDRWSAGVYSLDVHIGDEHHLCEVQFSESASNGSDGSIPFICQSESDATASFSAAFTPVVECVERRERNGDAVSEACTRVPESWFIALASYGTPSSLSMELRQDGVVLFQKNIQPKYEEYRPNGPDCEPVCRQAQLEFLIE